MLPLLKKKNAGDSAVCVRPVCPILTVLEFLHTFPARTERPPFFWLNPLQRSCCPEFTGCFWSALAV